MVFSQEGTPESFSYWSGHQLRGRAQGLAGANCDWGLARKTVVPLVESGECLEATNVGSVEGCVHPQS